LRENPVSLLITSRLTNFVPDDLAALDEWAIEYLVELRHNQRLLRALWAASDLPFPGATEAQAQQPTSQ
jgi:hypothetical protein